MDKQRILREAQKIAAKFAFWMVSGNIEHLYGYAYESQGTKYELEIKFRDDFPERPPKIILHDDIKKLLRDINLDTLNNWTPNSLVVDIVSEINRKIQEALKSSEKSEDSPIVSAPEPIEKLDTFEDNRGIEAPHKNQEEAEYITPDLDAYPPDFEHESYLTPDEDLKIFDDKVDNSKGQEFTEKSILDTTDSSSEINLFIDEDEIPLAISTELGLLQQEYAYDQIGDNPAVLNVYLTITISKTFLISIDYQSYPERPIITLPEEMANLVSNPYEELKTLREWNPRNPIHIVDIVHELEKKLAFISQVELESKKIRGEYKCNYDKQDEYSLQIVLVTYGFKEYTMDMNLNPFPKIPQITLSPELETLIDVPISSLQSYANWREGESEAVELVRELSWLVDKNSRINFEIELLKEHYKNINYNPNSSILSLDMKGKMKTQDLTFQFQIDLPPEYPMKMPSIKILNEFEIEAHEKIKNDLQSSFKDFYEEWNPFSYLVDVFNLISKKIFEVSVVSCVICHKIDCPTCSLKIAGPDAKTCHVDCPYCDRSYHLHCWQQTIKSFGKCGFCLKTPPPNMMPS